jgi:hypothetical protein
MINKTLTVLGAACDGRQQIDELIAQANQLKNSRIGYGTVIRLSTRVWRTDTAVGLRGRRGLTQCPSLPARHTTAMLGVA